MNKLPNMPKIKIQGYYKHIPLYPLIIHYPYYRYITQTWLRKAIAKQTENDSVIYLPDKDCLDCFNNAY